MEEKIGLRLRVKRIECGIKPETAAAAARLEVDQYLACEAGKRRATTKELVNLCRLFEIKLVDLFRS